MPREPEPAKARSTGSHLDEADEQLMRRVQAGDTRALETLFGRYRARLFGFLLRRCGDGATAEDLIQETWLRVVRSRDRYDPGRRFSTWLFQVANNLSRDLARRRDVERRGRQSVEQREIVRQQLEDSPGHDLRLDMERRLAALPDRLREVLVLRYHQQLSEREIAEVVGIPQGTVKSRLHTAVRTLREGIEGEDAH